MKKINVGIIGCGTIANSAHAPNYQKNPKVNIKYCVDIIEQRAIDLRDKFGGEIALTDYHDILDDPYLDAISICVPNHLHASITIDCLNAKKAVLCEKPAAINYTEVSAMKKAADDNGKILNIGVVNRFNTSVNKVKDIINRGDLGEVYHVYCSFRSYRSIPGLGGQFTNKELSGGGVLIDWGVHFLDLIMYAIGGSKLISASGAAYSKLAKNLKDYTFVDMWAGPPDYDGVYDVEEFITGMVRTEGPTITLNGAWAQNINETAMFIEFLGDKGGIKLTYGGMFTMWTDKDDMLYEHKPDFNMSSMFYDELDSFIDCVVTGDKNRGNIDNVIEVTKIMDALYQSSDEGCEVTID